MRWDQTQSGRFLRALHLWWFGVLLFAPGFAIWITVLVLGVCNGTFKWPIDSHGFMRIYLPFFAAIVGLFVPLICLRLFRKSSRTVIGSGFAFYLVVMLTWGVIDIRNEHYQLGGHEQPPDVLDGGHNDYFHVYYTWFFLPYKLIEK